MHSSSPQTEATPLLGATAEVQNDLEMVPVIRLTLEHVQSLNPRELQLSQLCPHSLPTPSSRIAFALVVLLQWRLNRIRPRKRTRDIWQSWNDERDDGRTVEDIEHRVVSLWSEFLEDYRSPQEIEDALWSGFPDRESSQRTVRVIDFIADVDSPPTLLSHCVVYLSLIRTWKRGFLLDTSPLRSRNVTSFDRVCTPRVLHCTELIFHMSYLAALVHFLLFPPAPPLSGTLTNGHWHSLFLMAFAVSSLARSWSLSNIPFLLVFLSFSSCMPSIPVPGDIAFSVLVAALSLHTYQLHLPSGPTPIFLFRFDLCLPLCALLARCMSQIILPVFLLFLPVLLLTWSLLSLSLKDAVFPFSSPSLLPSPIETRIGLLFILVAEIVLLMPSLLTPVALASSLPRRDLPVSSWDRYSQTIGLDARKYFVRAVQAYSTPHTFPPPFNLLPLLFQLPSATLRVHGAPPSALATMERFLWRITVGPVALVVGTLWLWGIVT